MGLGCTRVLEGCWGKARLPGGEGMATPGLGLQLPPFPSVVDVALHVVGQCIQRVDVLPGGQDLFSIARACNKIWVTYFYPYFYTYFCKWPRAPKCG